MENFGYSNAKLTFEQVTEIRNLISEGKRTVDIANIYGVKEVTINQIKKGKSWVKKGGTPKLDTHCRRGHFRTEKNTNYKANGDRECKICRSAAKKAQYLRKKNAVQKTRQGIGQDTPHQPPAAD